jgi:hypothetical protein
MPAFEKRSSDEQRGTGEHGLVWMRAVTGGRCSPMLATFHDSSEASSGDEAGRCEMLCSRPLAAIRRATWTKEKEKELEAAGC